MTCPDSSRTMKSRTFSQISARVRGRSVPSVEYEEISSWIRSLSGSSASRVCMSFLLDCAESSARGRERFADTCGSGAARHVVNLEHIFQFHKPVKILLEMRIDAPQFFKRQ